MKEDTVEFVEKQVPLYMKLPQDQKKAFKEFRGSEELTFVDPNTLQTT